MEGTKKNELGKNPRASANPLSALLFCWTLPLFIKGYRRDLEVSDLTVPLKEHTSSVIGDKLSKAWEKELARCSITSLCNLDEQEEEAKKDAGNEQAKKKTPSLLRAIVRVFGAKVMMYGVILCVMELLLRVSQPLFLGGLIAYYAPGNAESGKITEQAAYLYAGAIILCSAINVLVMHPYMMAILHVGMKIRVSCCSLIYRKALRLSRTALGDTTAGQVVNLLSNDVSRLDVAIIFLHYLWVGPVETAVVTYFIYSEVGVSAVIGVAVLLLFIPLQAFLGKRTSTLRLRTALRTDERVRLMNEIITGIQVIKMYAWEKPFAYLVSQARKREIKEVRSTSYIRGVLLSFIMFSTRLSVFVSLVSYVLLQNVVTAEKAFVLTSYYNILRQTMTVFFPQGIGQVAEASVSIKRLQKFLMYDETPLSKFTPISKIVIDSKDKSFGHNVISGGGLATLEKVLLKTASPEVQSRDSDTESHTSNTDTLSAQADEKPSSVVITDATARWTKDQGEDTLHNVSLSIGPGMLVAVIGPVGSGKSSLLHAIIGELPLLAGTIAVNGSVSYASQEPWLLMATLR